MKPFAVAICLWLFSTAYAQNNYTVLYNVYKKDYPVDEGRKPNLQAALYLVGDTLSFYRYTSTKAADKKTDISGTEMHHGVIRYAKDSFAYDVHTWSKPKALVIAYDNATPWQLLNEEVVLLDLLCKGAKKGNVTAWYAPSVSAKAGPAYYSGLPGLIVKVNDEDTRMVYEMTAIKTGIPEMVYKHPLPILTPDEYPAKRNLPQLPDNTQKK